MAHVNQNVPVTVLSRRKSTASRDVAERDQITTIIRDHVLLKRDTPYRGVKVSATRRPDGTSKRFVAYLLRRDTYTADVVAVNVDNNLNVIDIVDGYDDQLEDAFEASEPDEEPHTYANVQLVVATPCDDIDSARAAVLAITEQAQVAGLQVATLLGPQATIGNYQSYLTGSPKLLGLVNIGHGYPGGIVLHDGALQSSWFQGLSAGALDRTVLYFNSCQVFNDPLKASIFHAGTRTFAGGIVNLGIGTSEEVCKCFWKKALTTSEPMGAALRACEASLYPEPNAHGIGGDVGPFKSGQQATIGIRAVNGRFLCAEGGGGGRLAPNRTWIRSWETFTLVELGNSKVALRTANGMYVCAEEGGGHGMVANRAAIGPWETFQYVGLGGNKFALRAQNGQYVCAENGGQGVLVANRANLAAWETFERIALRKVGIKVFNGKYVCAESAGSAPLISNRPSVDSWETFVLTDLGGGKVALQACNGRYVCAESAGGAPLIANRDWIQGWETFSYVDRGGGKFALQACNGKYVCAEGGGNRELIANRANLGPWETFTRQDLP